MLEIVGGYGVSRRSFLRVGALGLAGLTLPDLLRLRAEAAVGRAGDEGHGGHPGLPRRAGRRTSTRMTRSPTPRASSAASSGRSPTNVPGVSALRADAAAGAGRWTGWRSSGACTTTSADHGVGDALDHDRVPPGQPIAAASNERPSVGSIVARLRGAERGRACRRTSRCPAAPGVRAGGVPRAGLQPVRPRRRPRRRRAGPQPRPARRA